MTAGPAVLDGPSSPRTLPGWSDDDLAAALAAFRKTADRTHPDLADEAASGTDARRFFETRFRSTRPGPARLTGYYEPELPASLQPAPGFTAPIYRRPPGLIDGQLFPTRAEIETGALLAGLEIAWVEDAVEAFLLQVQGSGRLRLPDGATLRVNFDGRNGHPYRSVGRELIRRGHFAEGDVTPDTIRAWVRANGEAGRDLLRTNPSFVFFRTLPDLAETTGPLGALGRPVTASRSLAVDPDHIPLGLPVWIQYGATRRLMIAQDTGAAIRGPARADLFFGTGAEAGRQAGALNTQGRLTVLLPRQAAR